MFSMRMFKKFQRQRLQLFIRRFSSNSTCILPEVDLNYLCNPSNSTEIKHNIQKRKGIGDIDKVLELHKAWLSSSNSEEKEKLKQQLLYFALKVPNKSHPDIASLDEEPLVVKTIGNERLPEVKALEFHALAHNLNACRTENLSNYTGPRSYYFLDDLASLEQALIKYTLDYLRKLKFQLISVPDMLPRTVIESCGMDTRGIRNQVLLDCQSNFKSTGFIQRLSIKKIHTFIVHNNDHIIIVWTSYE